MLFAVANIQLDFKTNHFDGIHATQRESSDVLERYDVIFKRPGVAGAVLQTPSSLID